MGENFQQLWSRTAASNNTADNSINWSEGQLPSTVNDSARSMMAALAKYRDDINGSITTTGSANAYVLASTTTYTNLLTGLVVGFKANFTNTSAASLNLDGLGAKALRMFSASGDVALVTGNIVQNGHYVARYDIAANGGAGGWVVLNPTWSDINGPLTITSSSANALVVGPAGNTNPTLQVDASTASAATGIKIKSASAGAGVAVSVVSSATNENLTIDAKGAGTITIAGTSAGLVTIAQAVSISGTLAVTGAMSLNNSIAITSSNANALAVGRNGATNPTLQVDPSSANSATGIAIKSGVAGANVSLTTISSAVNESLIINAKGSGAILIGNVSTGGVSISNATQITSSSANALAVGLNGQSNPALQVDASIASVATGIKITANQGGSGVAINAISNATNESLTIGAKGTGVVNFTSDINWTGAAWSTYTPTITTGSGTITTLGTVTGRYKQLGKVVVLQLVIPITTNGTGAGDVRATVPVAIQQRNYGTGKDVGVSSKQLNVIANPATTLIQITNYDNTYPGANGAQLEATVVYEA